MADKLEDAEFWLPSEFLTDEDILMDNKKYFNKFGVLTGSNSLTRCFPSEFPYDSSLAFPETQSDEEDSLISGLTLFETQKVPTANRINEKARVLSTSPQSTLTQVGSWSGRSSPNGPSQVSSPRKTPLSSWDLIYQAAGQVARLKLSDRDGPTTNPLLTGPQKWLVPPPPPKSPSASVFHHNRQVRGHGMLKQAECGMWSYEQEIARNATAGGWNVNGRGFDPPSCVWPNPQFRQRIPPLADLGSRENNVRIGIGYGYGSAGGGGGLKGGRTGTGVFIPRVNASDSRKKPGSSPASSHSGRVTQQELNKMASVIPQSRFDYESFADYDMLVARRNAFLMQHRRNLRPEGSMGYEICLPQEWTY